ncbi:glycosyltransferase family 2 protein [Marinigracilibium pacificum]|uniref:Glycosyltransferase family 2 protein n=1 Tax=Marinigracilibium pacificum TaxID=2729599 RepID=A0A848IVW3_9BACT|nr:glycosyltransferase family 2 protein [Marinigracilibium pacificum]NMM47318.1 glycosyltransferase family 2 protein [Marinigracilibium pacificum]
MIPGLISILMPAKNAEPFLKECLNSVISQSETQWELIIINDHSTDNTIEIIKQYSVKDQRIQYYQNNETGIISALKQAYSYSQGKYIHRMDADDIMAQDKLLLLKQMLVEEGKGTVVTSPVVYFSKKEVSPGYKKYAAWLNNLCQKNNHWDHIYEECVIASPNWLIHREDLDKIGAFNSTIYPEDYDLVFRMYASGIKVKSVDKTLHLWREHQNRTSRRSENYSQKAFFKIKLQYWLSIEFQGEHITIIGAGKKGKILSDLLTKKKLSYTWLKDKPKKNSPSFKPELERKKSKFIITIEEKAQKEKLKQLFMNMELIEMKNFYFFR